MFSQLRIMIFKEVQTLVFFIFLLMDMYILTKCKGLEWHTYFLTSQLDYNGLFD
jgi:hypothetical protein